MKVAEISQFLFNESYRSKAVEFYKICGTKQLLIVPKKWEELNNGTVFEHIENPNYILIRRKVYFNWKIFGSKRINLLVFSPRVVLDLINYDPDILYIDFEPYSLVGLEFVILKKIFFKKSKIVFGSSQNIYKKYPFPFNCFEKFVLNNCDSIFSRTDEIKRILLQKGYKKNIYIIPHGINQFLFYPKLKKEKSKNFIIGYIGSLIIQKDLATLFRATSLLNNKSVTLYIVGDGSQKNDLMDLGVKLKIDHLICYSPSVKNSDLPDILNVIDIIVLPSITCKNWKEQFGRIIIEAMACGVPVIGSSSGSIPSVIGDGGLIFEESNAFELKKKIELLQCDNKFLEQLSVKARTRVLTHFAWDKIVSNMYMIFIELNKQIMN